MAASPPHVDIVEPPLAGSLNGLNAASAPKNALRLRVGLLVDSLVQPAWVERLVDEIQRSEVATVAVLVRNAQTVNVNAGATRLMTWYRNRAGLLYSIYMRLDAHKFPARPDAFTPRDISPLVPGVPIIDVLPRTTRFSDYFLDDDVDRILAHRLDVALRLDFRILRGRALCIARHGVWSYHHGDSRVNRGGPAGFWEVMDRHPVTGSVLQVLSEELDGGRALYRSYSSTHHISVNQNRHNYYWKTSTFAMRKLRDLHRDGALALAGGDRDEPPAYAERLYVRPTNARMARLLVRLAGRYVARKVRDRVAYSQWALAYRLSRPDPASDQDVPDLVFHRFRILTPPADRFWGDPFVGHADGRHHILFEDYSYVTRRGRISAITIEADGTPSAPVPVLERDYHLSYPCLFTWQGRHYMIPESNANGTVDVYRSTRFPYDWVHERTLFSGLRLVDVTVQEIDGRWWLFANVPATPDVHYESWTWDELHVYHADCPLGPWTPHPRNPVVSDVRRARPAGRLFAHDGAWYRPAQDCGGGYGVGLALQRITRLDPERYEEVPVASLKPNWRPGLVGFHTINAAAGCTVIDVRRRRWQNPLTGSRSGGPLHAEPAVAAATLRRLAGAVVEAPR